MSNQRFKKGGWVVEKSPFLEKSVQKIASLILS